MVSVFIVRCRNPEDPYDGYTAGLYPTKELAKARCKEIEGDLDDGGYGPGTTYYVKVKVGPNGGHLWSEDY